MKKLLLFLLLLNFNLNAQLTFDSSSIVNDMEKHNHANYYGENGCISLYETTFEIPTLLKSDELNSFNDYYYNYKHTFTVKDISGKIIATKISYSFPSEYVSNSNGYYTYKNFLSSGFFDFSGAYSIDAKVEIIKYVFNNDFGMGKYYPYIGTTSLVFWKYYVRKICNPTTINQPDLTNDKFNVHISSECLSCSNPLSNLGSKRHLISSNGSMTIYYIVDNKGNSTSNSAKSYYYLSTNKSLEEENDYKINISTSIPVIESGKSKQLSQTIFESDLGNRAFKDWNLIIKLDGGNSNIESSEKNNIIIIPITFTQNFNKIKPPKFLISEEENSSGINDENVYLKSNKSKVKNSIPYDLFIYTFNGQLIDIVKVENKIHKKKLISRIPQGFYILNSIYGSSKIYVER